MLSTERIEEAEKNTESIEKDLFDFILEKGQAEVLRHLERAGDYMDAAYLSRIVNKKQEKMRADTMLTLAKRIAKAFRV
jgi:hypothetical protein